MGNEKRERERARESESNRVKGREGGRERGMDGWKQARKDGLIEIDRLLDGMIEMDG